MTSQGLTLAEQEGEINKINAQIANKKKLISEKMQELKISKKENPFLEGIYNEYKKINQSTIDALSILHSYLQDLEVSDEDLKEKKNDLKRIAAELKKCKCK
jgi:hypothetical protein